MRHIHSTDAPEKATILLPEMATRPTATALGTVLTHQRKAVSPSGSAPLVGTLYHGLIRLSTGQTVERNQVLGERDEKTEKGQKLRRKDASEAAHEVP